MQDGGLYRFERSSFSTVEHPTAVMENKGTWHRHGYCNATGKASRKCRPQRSTAIPCTQIRESCNIVFEHSKQCCTVSLVDVEGELCLPKPMMDAQQPVSWAPKSFLKLVETVWLHNWLMVAPPQILRTTLICSKKDINGIKEQAFFFIYSEEALVERQWEFQDPKMEVLYHISPYFVGVFPYIALT